MRLLLVPVCVVGCFSPRPTSGVPCGANDSCPAPLVCSPASNTCETTATPGTDADVAADSALQPDAAACVGAALDEDADGVPNQCDNCPVTPNEGQEDVGETSVGANADGVGDACDPRPAQTAIVSVSWCSTTTLPPTRSPGTEP
ncbi:MAG: thrombospondin type 3 repeat-containing protein [Kofleriaceae bacterium]